MISKKGGGHRPITIMSPLMKLVDKIIDTEWNLTNHYGDGQFGAQTNGIPKISLMMQSLIHLSNKGELGGPWVIMALDGEMPLDRCSDTTSWTS